MKTFPTRCVGILIATLVAAAASAQVIIGPEPFNTAASTTADGWAPHSNPGYGWSGTINAGGPAGELGGNITNSDTVVSWSVPLGATYDLTTNFSGSGAFAITNSSPGAVLNYFLGIGFFNSAQVGTLSNQAFVGCTFQEFGGSGHTTDWRSRAGFLNMIDGNALVNPPFYLPSADHAPYTFKWDYNPAAGRGTLVVHYYHNGIELTSQGSPKSVQLPDDPNYAKTNLTFDSFGVISGKHGSVGFMSFYMDNLKGIIGPAPACIQASSEGVSVIGSSSQTVTVTIPSSMNTSTAATVTVTSGDLGVAVPQGAVGGVLTLTFPLGGATAQSFNVVPVAVGSTTFAFSDTVGVCVDNAVQIDVYPVPRSLTTKSEPFNTAISAAQDGWVESKSHAMGQNYGFSNTSNAGGPAGEAGGTFDYATNNSYHADVFPSVLTLNDSISASGKFILQAPAVNNTVRVAHFLTTSPTSAASQIGFEVSEPAPTGNPPSLRGRIYPLISLPNGNNIRSAARILDPDIGIVYDWNYTYDPTTGILTLAFTDGFTPVSGTAKLNTFQRAQLANLDAFGVFAPASIWTTNQPDAIQLFIDNVSYTVAPTPLKITGIAVAGSNLQVTFTTPSPGASHSVRQSSLLLPTSWLAVPGVSFSTSGNSMTATFPKPGSNRFYQVTLP